MKTTEVKTVIETLDSSIATGSQTLKELGLTLIGFVTILIKNYLELVNETAKSILDSADKDPSCSKEAQAALTATFAGAAAERAAAEKEILGKFDELNSYLQEATFEKSIKRAGIMGVMNNTQARISKIDAKAYATLPKEKLEVYFPAIEAEITRRAEMLTTKAQTAAESLMKELELIGNVEMTKATPSIDLIELFSEADALVKRLGKRSDLATEVLEAVENYKRKRLNIAQRAQELGIVVYDLNEESKPTVRLMPFAAMGVS